MTLVQTLLGEGTKSGIRGGGLKSDEYQARRTLLARRKDAGDQEQELVDGGCRVGFCRSGPGEHGERLVVTGQERPGTLRSAGSGLDYPVPVGVPV